MDETKSPPRRKTTIEIPLPSQRRYGPGSGPPPPKISLLPVSDSTAYIIDQFVLPTDKDMTPTSRRLIHYHIGFTDLPAAKLLIPCNKVLDYVSPRELEDWEYRNAERLAEAKKAQQAALKEQQMARKKKAAAAAASRGKRPVGRPPKAKSDDSGDPNPTSPTNEALALVQQVAGPSLTPKKRKLSMALENEDVVRDMTSDQESDEAAIQRQLHPDFVGKQWVGNSEAESVYQLGAPAVETSGADTSRASSRASSRRKALPPLSQPILSARKETPSYPPKPKPTSRGSTTATAIKILNIEEPVSPIPPKPHYTPSRPPKARENAVASTQSSQPSNLGNLHPALAATFRVFTEQLAGAQNGAGDSKKAKTTPAKSHETQQSKTIAPAQPPEEAGMIAQWTPAAVGRGRLSKSTETPSSASASRDPSQEKDSQKKEKKAPKPRKKKAAPPEEEVYDVKELLDDEWVTERNGHKVHKYLVLWVGEWPEGQNPTWEPVENIEAKDLVRQYHEKKDAGALKKSPATWKLPPLKPPPRKKQKTLPHFFTGKQYSSVAEAFEDGLEIEPADHHSNIEDIDVDKEEFLVTASLDNLHPQYRKSLSFNKNNKKEEEREGGGASSNGKVVSMSQTSPSFRDFDATLARYQQSQRGYL
ncbi:hypothetical protein QBC40DRAFT_233294 [Triangularia verruculosa]|uniref:Chromo domain-containing protein n=1 Tax=Triangularia verruculosa TaxID=2587418 RepID=A0AAN6XCM7_9PEZI|nr:hypothetical protein QBC40DRAFT_233294 [Triangularia verruculosa]